MGEDVVAAVVGKPGVTVDPAALREHVSASLSGYKVPTRVLVVDHIPRNAIGKALRREMPILLASRLVPESLGPSTPIEQALLTVWQKVLRRTDIGITDNVFQFGADPLRADMAAELIDKVTGVRMTTKLFYAKPTVSEQAAHCAIEGVRS